MALASLAPKAATLARATEHRSCCMESSHTSALQIKHATLQRQIEQEMTRPSPDLVTIQHLKRRKLRIKDELTHD